MTDRQTGIFLQRSQWWSVTCYDDNIDRIEDVKLFPRCVKKVHGGREKCPTTGRDHFQGAVECNGQQRAVFFRDWLPGVHFEKARSKDALKKYALKADTAVGVKATVENPIKYMTMDDILVELGLCYYEEMDTGSLQKAVEAVTYVDKLGLTVCPEREETIFWHLVTACMRKHGRYLASSLANPAIRKMWINTKEFWLQEALSITGPTDKEPENEIISPA